MSDGTEPRNVVEEVAPQHQFVMIEHAMLTETDLSPSAIVLYMALRTYANSEGKNVFPSMATLAKRAHISPSTAKTALKDLQALGLVEKTSRKREGSNEYTSNLYRVFHPSSPGRKVISELPTSESDQPTSESDQPPTSKSDQPRATNDQELESPNKSQRELESMNYSAADATDGSQTEIIDVPFTDTTGYEPIRPQFQKVLDIEPENTPVYKNARQRGYALAGMFYKVKGVKQRDMAKRQWEASATTFMSLPDQYTEDDVERCTRYMLTLWKYREPTTLQPSHVVQGLPEWVAKGRMDVSADYAKANGDQRFGQSGKMTGDDWRAVRDRIRAQEQQSHYGD